jgi:hypothetical protein
MDSIGPSVLQNDIEIISGLVPEPFFIITNQLIVSI